MAIGLAVLGMPHGAIDHLVPDAVAGRPTRPSTVAGVCAAYLATVAAGLALWFAAPVPALLIFLVIASAHWGQGDLWFLRAVDPSHAPTGPMEATLAAAARGLLPVFGPMLLHPAATKTALDQVLRPFAADSAALMTTLTAANAGRTALLLLAAVAGAQALARRARREAAELSILLIFVCVCDPVIAIGTYFTAWHSVRHIARLCALRPAGSTRRSLTRFAIDAAPLTVIALVICATAATTLGPRSHHPGANSDPAIAATIAFTAALTLPHAIIVAAMHRAPNTAANRQPPSRQSPATSLAEHEP